MIYGYIRTSRPAVDGLAGMHPETQLQALADAGLEPGGIVSDVEVSASVWPRPSGTRPRHCPEVSHLRMLPVPIRAQPPTTNGRWLVSPLAVQLFRQPVTHGTSRVKSA